MAEPGLGRFRKRPPRSGSELRQRTGRYFDFTSLPELEQVLTDLGERGLVRRLARQLDVVALAPLVLLAPPEALAGSVDDLHA